TLRPSASFQLHPLPLDGVGIVDGDSRKFERELADLAPRFLRLIEPACRFIDDRKVEHVAHLLCDAEARPAPLAKGGRATARGIEGVRANPPCPPFDKGGTQEWAPTQFMPG